MKIYLAGKITKNDWREKLIDQVRGVDWKRTMGMPMLGTHTCTGPFFVNCKHGCGYAAGMHATGNMCEGENFSEVEVVEKSLAGIRAAHMVFCFAQPDYADGRGTDFALAHGTHAELGYAKGLGRRIVVCRHPMLDPTRTWFPLALADLTIAGEDPVEALRGYLKVTLWAEDE